MEVCDSPRVCIALGRVQTGQNSFELFGTRDCYKYVTVSVIFLLISEGP